MRERITKIGNKQWLYALFTLLGFSLFWAGTDFSPFEIAVGGLLVVSALLVLIERKRFLIIPHHLIWLSAFAALLVVQTLYLPKSLFFNLVTFYLMAIFFVVRAWYREYPSVFWSLALGYLSGAVLSAAWGLFLFAGDPWLDTWAAGQRYMGLLDDPEVYGALLVPAVLTFASLFFTEKNTRNSWLYGISGLVVLCGVVLSGSHGAWLNLSVAGAVVLVFSTNLYGRLVLLERVLPFFACGLVLATSLIYFVPLNGSTFYETTFIKKLSASEQPQSEKEKVWVEPERLGEPSILHLSLGQGGGAKERFTEIEHSRQGTYVRILFEQGLLGLFLFAGFLAHSLFGITDNGKLNHQATILVMASAVGVLAQGFFIDTLHWRHWWLLLALLL